MKWRVLTTLTLAATLWLFSDALAATYYVSPNGNDANPGTSISAPWRTIAKANSRLVAGDTVYLRGGTYSEQIKPANNGGEYSYITYARYQQENVILNGGYDQADLSRKSFVVIDGLNFQNANRYWVNLSYSTQCVVKNSTFVNALGYYGIDMRYASYCKLIANNLRAGDCGGTDSGVDGCPYDTVGINFNAHHNLLDGNVFGNTSHYSIGIGYGANYNVIKNNTIENKWHGGIGLGGDPNTHRNLIESNTIKNCGMEGTQNPWEGASRVSLKRGLQIHSYTTHSIIRKNTVFNNGANYYGSASGSTLPTEYNKIYNNVFDQAARTIWSSNDGGQVSYNSFKNNSFSRGSDYNVLVVAANNTRDINYFTHNNWYNLDPNRNRYKLQSLVPISTIEVSYPNENFANMTQDPRFVSWLSRDYSLTAGSPLIDAGTWLTTITSIDGNGTTFGVADAGYFCDGWGIIQGDTIQIQGSAATSQIKSINYSNNTITLSNPISWKKGLGISLPYSGLAPDIGAYEYNGQASRLLPPHTLKIQN